MTWAATSKRWLAHASRRHRYPRWSWGFMMWCWRSTTWKKNSGSSQVDSPEVNAQRITSTMEQVRAAEVKTWLAADDVTAIKSHQCSAYSVSKPYTYVSDGRFAGGEQLLVRRLSGGDRSGNRVHPFGGRISSQLVASTVRRPPRRWKCGRICSCVCERRHRRHLVVTSPATAGNW